MAHKLRPWVLLLMVGVLSWLSQPLSSSSVQDPEDSCVCQQSCQGTIETTPLRTSLPSGRNPSSGCVCMQTCQNQEQNNVVTQELRGLATMMINLQQQVAALNDSLYELMTARQLPTTARPPRPACPSNYVQNETVGLCYKVYQEGSKLSWQDAKERCESFGAQTRLAVLDTWAKYLHIQQVLPTALDDYNSRPETGNWSILTAWIGARQDPSQSEARYLWLTGQEFTGVRQQQTNDQSGQCVAFEHNRPLFWMTELLNEDCTEPHWYICEVNQEVN